MTEFMRVFMLIFILLNPFFLVVYLVDVLDKVPQRSFHSVVFRAGLIACAVFALFALVGDVIFRDILGARFASFQIFGGVIFLLIGIRFVFHGHTSVEVLRGDSTNLAGAIAMPVMIGPGTVGASVLAGQRLGPVNGIVCIVLAVALSVAIIMLLKLVYDFVRPRNERLVARYIESMGRVAALVVGTLSVEMIMRGLATWSELTP